MHHANRKRFHSLTRQRTARGVTHRHREHDFQSAGSFSTGNSIGLVFFLSLDVGAGSSLGIQGIENGFHQDGVHPLFNKNLDLFQVGIFQFVKCDGTIGRIVHIIAHGEHLAGGAHITSDINLTAVFFETFLGGLLGDLYGSAIHLRNAMFLMILVLAHPLARESIGGQHIYARIHIAALNIQNHIRTFNRKHVVIGALNAIILNDGTHTAIQEHHLTFKSFAKSHFIHPMLA